jgi:hypothetical protein
MGAPIVAGDALTVGAATQLEHDLRRETRSRGSEISRNPRETERLNRVSTSG